MQEGTDVAQSETGGLCSILGPDVASELDVACVFQSELCLAPAVLATGLPSKALGSPLRFLHPIPGLRSCTCGLLHQTSSLCPPEAAWRPGEARSGTLLDTLGIFFNTLGSASNSGVAQEPPEGTSPKWLRSHTLHLQVIWSSCFLTHLNKQAGPERDGYLPRAIQSSTEYRSGMELRPCLPSAPS